METNRNGDRLKYLINDHSIINQGKHHFLMINERKKAQLESQNVTEYQISSQIYI